MSKFRGTIEEKSAGAGGRPKGDLPTAGMHGAVIVAIVDMGTHPDKFEVKETGEIRDYDRHRLLLAVELTSKPLPDGSGNNWVYAKEFTLSFKEGSNLAKLAGAVLGLSRGQAFDVADLLGKPCSAEIEQTAGKEAGKFYANLKGIKGRAEGLPIKRNKRDAFIWTFEDGTEPNLPSWLPGWVYGNKVLDIINDSIEARARKKTAQGAHADTAPTRQPAPTAGAAWDEGLAEAQGNQNDDIPF